MSVQDTVADFAAERVTQRVGARHELEELTIEHRAVAGVPSVEVRCRCREAFAFTEYAEHVARQAVNDLRQELRESGVLS